MWYEHAGSLWKCGVLLKPLLDNLYGRKYWYRGEESLEIKGGDDLPWLQPFALELLDEMLGVFEVVGGLTYQWLNDVS